MSEKAGERTIHFNVEGQRLWNQLTKGMDGIYRVAKDYADIGLPGDPLAQLRLIHADLGEVIKTLEKRTK
jgi:hypothetical protein